MCSAMEVTLMDGGIGRLQNPNFLSRLSELAGISFWTWGALVLAAIATLTSLVRRTRALTLHLRFVRSLRTPTPTPLCEYDSDGDDTCSSCSSGEESDDEEEEEEEETLLRGWRWSFSDDMWTGAWGLDVVKAWGEDSDMEEEERLLLPFASSPSASLLSLWDRSRGATVRSLPADQIEAVHGALPGLTMSQVKGMRVWDERVGGDVPAMIATQWPKPDLRRRVSDVATRGDGGVVYLNGDGGAGSLVDLRKPSKELATGETWWDAE